MDHPRVALVTGSGKRRVGRGGAEALASRGDAIALHYRSPLAGAEEAVAEFEARGSPVRAFPADLADQAAVEGLVRAVREHWGRIDVVANCAAIWHSKRLEDVTAADVR